MTVTVATSDLKYPTDRLQLNSSIQVPWDRAHCRIEGYNSQFVHSRVLIYSSIMQYNLGAVVKMTIHERCMLYILYLPEVA